MLVFLICPLQISIPLLILADVLWIHYRDPAYDPEWYLHQGITQYGKPNSFICCPYKLLEMMDNFPARNAVGLVLCKNMNIGTSALYFFRKKKYNSFYLILGLVCGAHISIFNTIEEHCGNTISKHWFIWLWYLFSDCGHYWMLIEKKRTGMGPVCGYLFSQCMLNVCHSVVQSMDLDALSGALCLRLSMDPVFCGVA